MNDDTPPDDMPDHLKFIQEIVERLSRYSFLIKGWSVTLIAAVIVLVARGVDKELAIFAGGIPSFAFWYLDAYYLQQERTFRKLYDKVRRGECAAERFALDTTSVRTGFKGFICAAFAPPVVLFHGVIIGAALVGLYFFCGVCGHGA